MGLGKKIGIAALSLVGALGVIEAVAAVRVHRLRARRAYLGDRLYTEIRGAGDPVVFLAGLPATTHFWQGAFDPLARSHRLIFVDALGFGRSPLPDADYTLEDHLGALRRTLVAAGATRRVTFVAHSFGTVLAAYYAQRHPDEVDRLVLLGTPVFDSEREARAHIRETSSMSGLFVLNPLLAREACKLHEAALSPALARLVAAFLPGISPDIAREGMLHTWQSFNGSLRNVLLRRPIAIPLAGLGPKVTFVHGRADHITSLVRIQALAQQIGARVLTTEDEHLSYPAKSAERILVAVGGG
jgi:pimeloyl-ACP methyl ester carboxylesterase